MNDHTSSGASTGKGKKSGGFLGRLLWGSQPGEPVFDDAAPAEETFKPRFEDDTIDAETMAEVMEQLSKKRKIEAIKIYREATGCGLKDAKESVERLAGKRAA